MASQGTKRPASREASISPPPIKRKITSTTSKKAVSSFFTPTSQKPKIDIIWNERAPSDDVPATLLVAKYKGGEDENSSNEPSEKRRKIAAFDLDSTLIIPASGKKHGNEPGDWKWWDKTVPQKLRELYNDQGYRIVIFSNQAGITLHADPKGKGPKKVDGSRATKFKQKCGFVLSDLDIPLTLYAATGKDRFRKPRPGMWTEMLDDYDLKDAEVVRTECVFVGDAGGRTASIQEGKAIPKDFSCSDRNLAHNIGIPYKTPEEFFLGQPARDFTRGFDLANHPFDEEETASDLFTKKNDKDIVLFCGPPGAGKSTFFWRHLKPAGYQRVNQDLLKSKDKCLKVANELLQQGESVAVDNTNADADTRSLWIDLAKKHKVPTRCIWFKTPLSICEHNDTFRSMNETMNPESREGLPKMAFSGFTSRYKEPKLGEGFQDITEVEFKFRGTEEEYGAWGRYWL